MPPKQKKAALAAYRPLPFPSPFGTAYVLDPLPPAVDEDDLESNAHRRRNSAAGWSSDTLCTWEEFAVDDKLVDGVSSSSREPETGPVLRFTQWIDRKLGPRLTELDINRYTEAYTEGYGTPSDPHVVRFLAGDSQDPLIWSTARKWVVLLTSGSATFAVAFGSSVYVGGTELMVYEFRKTVTVTLLGLSFYVGGMGIGPMLWAPMSELIGRRPVFIATFIPFFILQIPCAVANNIETLIICRMLAGSIGSAPLTNSAGIVGDVFTAYERGIAMCVYALMPFLGPVFGPIVGGYVGSWKWRWLFWVTTILAGICLVGGALIPETHAPVILRRRAMALSAATGKTYKSLYDVNVHGRGVPSIKTYFTRPFVLLFREPIVMLFALYAAIIYGILYLMFGCYPVVFVQDRGWEEGPAGLPFIAVGIGMLFGMAGTVYDSMLYGKKLSKADGPLAPEERLRGACVGGVLLPISLAWFAASAKPSVHWLAPTIAGGLFGCSMLLIFMGGTAYLVDTYLTVAASAMAANSFMRSLFAAAFPLFTLYMFQTLGAPWSLGLLSFVTLLCTPIPFLFFTFGHRIREKSPYAASNPSHH